MGYPCCRMYDSKNHIGKYSLEELKKLQELRKQHGNDWQKIGLAMGRSAASIKDRCRHLKEDCNAGNIMLMKDFISSFFISHHCFRSLDSRRRRSFIRRYASCFCLCPPAIIINWVLFSVLCPSVSGVCIDSVFTGRELCSRYTLDTNCSSRW